ncbi:LytTR family DNA-binding domain-containing protein [Spirosoma sp. KNUC1025]|uniref:LytR/AlgR family response regulator transcription factor n=1 Tax=Spirosoma sp. KNUC1025 TaxID=2894082 RepID=UPI00386E572A|nr:LytTR family DNA-binding domain-containing protein [Spirosoma sp. KNUC1025]
MKAIIIEDEAIIADKLRDSLSEIAPHVEVQTILPSIKAARRWFSQYAQPDLLFMDIQLSDGVSFELFQYFDLRCPIIFTTAYDEYALKAFKVNSIDYLLKPIDEDELIRAMEKLKTRTAPMSLPAEVLQFMAQQATSPVRVYKEKLLTHQRNSVVMVEVNDIGLIYRDEIIFLLRNDGQSFVADYASLDEIETVLDPAFFFRANRTQIININAVDSFRPDSSGKLYLKLKINTSAPVEISREKAPLFRRWLDR